MSRGTASGDSGSSPGEPVEPILPADVLPADVRVERVGPAAATDAPEPGTGPVATAAAARGVEGAACHNCGAALHGRFCAACGQEAKPLNPRLRDILRDLIEELLDVDGRIFRSVRRLFLSPGFLTREQFRGRRASWLAPVRLYLLFSVMYFAVASFTDTNVVTVRVRSGGQAIATAQEKAEALGKIGYENEEALQRALRDVQATWLPRVMFVLVPVFAGLVALVRRRSGMGYPLHVYFALHVHAVWFGVRALGAVVRLRYPSVAAGLDAAGVAYVVVYVYLALRTAYDVPRRRALFDTAIIVAAYWVVIVAVLLATFVATIWR